MASRNYNKSGTITADQSNLLRDVTKVLDKDRKDKSSKYQDDLTKRKVRKDLSLNEAILQVESAASDTLASYPGENARQFPMHEKPRIASVDKYYGDEPGVSPRIEPNISNELESKELQMKVYLAAREMARLYSRIVDDRKTPISDVQRLKGFMKDLMGALLDEND
jgi:hypothetical protein